MKREEFNNCFISSRPKKTFYSPFILGLIGIFLIKSKEDKTQNLLNAIEKKLLKTYNKKGVYNFYGNENYYFDIDTTSIVNIFLTLMESKEIDSPNKIIKRLEQNKEEGDLLLRTWINRDNNHIDWVVNYNFYVYSFLCKRENICIKEQLITGKDHFFKNGSRYYNNIHFPLFLLEFYKIEFNLGFLPFDQNLNSFHTDINLFQYSSEILKRNIDLNSLLLKKYLNSTEIYFNSNKHLFASHELNAAILLYLINKNKNYE